MSAAIFVGFDEIDEIYHQRLDIQIPWVYYKRGFTSRRFRRELNKNGSGAVQSPKNFKFCK